MSMKLFGMAAVLLLLVLAVGLLFPGDAHAQSADQKMAQREGLGNKEFDKEQLPGKLEVGLALGSVIAAIAVVKFL